MELFSFTFLKRTCQGHKEKTEVNFISDEMICTPTLTAFDKRQ
jgi:hypothetical protein